MDERITFTKKMNEPLLRERLSHDYLQNESPQNVKIEKKSCVFVFLLTNGEIYNHFKTMRRGNRWDHVSKLKLQIKINFG